ncbi:MAG: molybdopterin molybdotransferase MoeA [Nitriliruptorales bacterium]|nr:molybdopterin molybdotransferase MoeA [Nitriliruptorales bacterium]
MTLTPVEDVVAAVERSVHPTPVSEIPIARCWRAVLARDVAALVSLPPHDNSAMDGYAVRAEDTTEARPADPVSLRVVGRSHAGFPSVVPCTPGDAVEIATGALVPAGADAVVRVEEVEKEGEEILVRVPVESGRDVRRRGEDVAHGDVVLERGVTLGQVQLAAAAACGHRSLPVHRPAHLTVVLTGDEVSRRGDLEPGQVPDALGDSMMAALTDEGPVDVDLVGPVGDDHDRLAATIGTAASVSDLIVTIGGVSVGPRDRVAATIEDLGSVERWRVAVKPGKPFALGIVDEVPVLCLPGNPIAALVAYELFVRAAVGQLAGRPFRPAIRPVRLTAAVEGDGERLRLVRGHVAEGADHASVTPVGRGGSGRVASAGTANVWIVVPPGTARLDAGDEVMLRPMAGA